ncbi:MAG: histone deacetylase [Candelina mexicana]|nr:MAG: histone deacetylase [Candelina mexicana]
MVRSSGIVQNYYEHAQQEGGGPTLTVDEKVRNEIARNGIVRPQGYTVSWHSNPDIEPHHFGPAHPMKPFRLTLTNSLVKAYGMRTAMDDYKSRAATKEEMAEFHKEDFLDFLQRVLPDDDGFDTGTGLQYNIGQDCPIFDGLYEYCSLYAGASIDAARKLCNNQSQIAINWSGGLHHAKKSEASGFCYINDIVLGILQLLRYYPRVLYIDIDVHHGDGVEEAFWSTDRVMTVSFHKYDGHFFPGTGPVSTTGPPNPLNPGAHHSLNVPLNDGIGDEDYKLLFEEIIGACIDSYRPSVIVIQCGADSLASDRLGMFNLNIRGHGACVEYVKRFHLPLLILGGGGYTPRNVARLWTYETSVCIGAQLNEALPAHTEFLNHLTKDSDPKVPFPTLIPPLIPKYANANTPEYLRGLVTSIKEQLRYQKGAPSVQMQHIPPDIMGIREDVDMQIEEMRMESDEGWRREKERAMGVRGEMYID